MKNAKNTNQKNVRYRGTSIVEAAFILVILLLITLGIMGFGWLFLRVQQVTTAARHGARIAVIYREDESTVTAEVTAAVNNLLNPVNLEHDDPSIIYPSGTGVGDPITVSVKGKSLDLLNLGNPTNMLFIPIPDTYTASVTMSKEGP
jgi:hypothetical protein